MNDIYHFFKRSQGDWDRLVLSFLINPLIFLVVLFFLLYFLDVRLVSLELYRVTVLITWGG